MLQKNLIDRVVSNFRGVALIVSAFSLVFMLSGCGGDDGPKKAERSAEKPITSSEGQQLPQGHPEIKEGAVAPSAEAARIAPPQHREIESVKEVRLEDEVKKKWTSANLGVTDNSTGQKVDITVKVGQKVKVDAVSFMMLVEAFVPDYTIYEDHIGSRSNEANNPAILVSLFDGDKQVARGWIFAELPTYNSYSHIRYSVVLKEPFTPAK